MVLLYNLLATLFALIYLPYVLLKGKWHAGFFLRLGIIPKILRTKLVGEKNIWIHAVSVGEVLSMGGVIRLLKERFPKHKIVLSTVTKPGFELAKTKLPEVDTLIFAPLDLSWIVNRFLNVINPQLYIVAETEIWPNLLWALKTRQVPVVMINGRISVKTFARLKRFSFFFKPLWSAFQGCGMQSILDAQRIIALGVCAPRVQVVGNVKFDEVVPAAPLSRKDFKYSPEDCVWVAGSTHPGEEVLILKVFQNLRREFPLLKLILAPRHVERCLEVEGIIHKAGESFEKLSQIFSSAKVIENPSVASEKYSSRGIISPKQKRFLLLMRRRIKKDGLPAQPILLVDTLGSLRSLYSLATVVFVGKSLCVGGGHNTIEPAFFAKPIWVGPLMQNFKDILNIFMEGKGIVQVQNEQELESSLREFLKDPARRLELGRRAREVVERNQGATLLTVKIIEDIFPLSKF